MLFTFNLFNAIADVVIDAIMVTIARKDPEHGSADLQSLHVVSVCVGGITGSVIASYVNDHFHPYTVFSFYAIMSLLTSVLAFCVEEIRMEDEIGAWENVKRSLKHLSRWIVLGTLIFILISCAIIPSYSDIMYYFMINVLDFGKKTIALLSLAAFCTAILGPFIYNLILKKLEYRTAMIVGHITIALAVLTTWLLVTRISKEVFGINDILFSFFTDASLEIFMVAFIFMPTLVVQTKIVPKNVEATVYSVFASIRNFSNDVISPLIGGLIADSFGVTNDNFSKIGSIVLIQLGFSLVPICFIWLLPTNKTIEEFYAKIRKPDEDKKKLVKSSFGGSENHMYGNAAKYDSERS